MSSSVDVFDYVIIGGGLSGLSAYRILRMRNVTNLVVLERQPTLGGCWANVANDSTMTQTESSNYNFHVHLAESKEEATEVLSNTLYTRSEMVQQAQQIYKQNPHIRLNADAKHIAKDNASNTYRVAYFDSVSNSSVTLTTRRVWFFPGVLYTAVQHTFDGEQKFAGKIYHTSNTISADDYRSFNGKDIVIVGTGAFALENVRNALENGAGHITIVARTSRFVFPRAIGWSISANQGKPLTIDQILRASNTMYQQTLNRKTEDQDWYFGDKQGMRMCNISAISDLYFLAQKVGKLTVVENADIQSIHQNTVTVAVRNAKESATQIKADVLIKSLGFTSDRTVSRVFSSVGSTVKGYWVNGDKNFFFFHPPEKVGDFIPLSLEMVSFSVLTYIQLVILAASALDERPNEKSEETENLIQSFPSYEMNTKTEEPSYSIPFMVTGAVLGASFAQTDVAPKLFQMVKNKSVVANTKLPLPHVVQTLTKEWVNFQDKWGIKSEDRVPYPYSQSDIEKIIALS